MTRRETVDKKSVKVIRVVARIELRCNGEARNAGLIHGDHLVVGGVFALLVAKWHNRQLAVPHDSCLGHADIQRELGEAHADTLVENRARIDAHRGAGHERDTENAITLILAVKTKQVPAALEF